MTLPGYVAWRTVSPTPSEYWRDGLQALIDQGFENASNVFTIQKLNTSTNLYENITVRLDTPYDIKQNTTFEDDFRKIIFKDNTKLPLVGDSYYFNDFYWICIDKSNVNSPTISCIVQKCKHSISLYKSGILSQVPIIVLDRSNINDTKLKYNKYISSIDCDIVGVVSRSERNLLIESNDVFQIGKYSYVVIKVDDLSKYGLLLLPMKFVENQQETHVFVTSILNGSSINIQQGTTIQLNIQVTDNNEVISSPTITYSSSDTDICTVSSSGLVSAIDTGDCIINVSCNGASDSIEITVVEEEQHNYTYILSSTTIPDTEIKLNQTKTYTAYKYNNGVAVSQEFTFSVTGDKSAYTLTTVDGNTCTVKCLKSGYVVTLKATDDSDGTKIVEKNITLKSIF
jgi:hypothetical protein